MHYNGTEANVADRDVRTCGACKWLINSTIQKKGRSPARGGGICRPHSAGY